MEKWLPQRVWNALFVIGFLNFVVFVVVAILIGGDAVNGHRTSDHYYLRNHGQLTEVSAAVWQYSRIHVYSIWVTHPLAMFAAWRSNRAERRKLK